ncbi:MAG: thiol-disulfide isomerase [Terriglobales bacterium]
MGRVRSVVLLVLIPLLGIAARAQAPRPGPTFYRNVLPILQQHCQICHRPGEIGPMPLETYAEAKPYARRMAQKTTARQMPPWFAVPGIGHWANDPSLTAQQMQTLAAWAAAGAPAGDLRQAPAARQWTAGWNIPKPARVFRMPVPVAIPAHGQVEYTYEIVPTGFRHAHWVQMAEVRPTARAHVHHAVVYVRPPGSSWLRHAPVGKPFTASSLLGHAATSAALWTNSEILLVYAPGSAPARYGPQMGEYIPAGSDLVFQMHYTTNGKPARDQTSVGLVFNRRPPKQRVLTLQLTNDHFVIPPGVKNFRVEAWGTLPGPATLLSFFPHMHLRGKRFEYDLVGREGRVRPLLKVNYDFYWERSYILAHPLALPAGTKLQAVAWYDNSADNPHNPDPEAAVYWGDQTSDEMMVGFFKVAVPAGVSKWQYFAERKRP